MIREGLFQLSSTSKVCQAVKIAVGEKDEGISEEELLSYQAYVWKIAKDSLILFFQMSLQQMKKQMAGQNQSLAQNEQTVKFHLKDVFIQIPD